MRRLTAVLLIVCVLTGCSGCEYYLRPNAFQTDTIQSVNVTGDPAVINTVEDDPALRDSFVALLNGAAKPEAEPEAPETVLEVIAGRSGGSETAYTVLREAGRYFARGEELLLELDAAGFQAMLALMSGADYQEYYRYSELPGAEIAVGGDTRPLDLTETGYWYRGMDSFEHEAGTEPSPAASGTALGIAPGDILSVQLSQPASDSEAEILRNGDTVWSGDLEELESFSPERSGDYELLVSARFDDDNSYYGGSVSWRALLRYEIPLSFSVTGDNTFPGELVILRAHNVPEDAVIEFISGIMWKPEFFRDGEGGRVALLPFGTNNGVGEYAFTLKCGDYSEDYVVRLNDKEFEIQNMNIDNETANETVYSQQANVEFNNVISPLRPVSDPEQYWSDDFMWPLEERRVTTHFGMIRYVNNAPTSTRHNAIDFGSPQGTPVYAVNSGRVLYAGFLQLTGNTVLIEHGHGLKSWYYHMVSLDVETGQMAERGQKIGEVGTTGFSTGPHLHFGMSVNNVYVNPQTIIEGQLLTKEEELS